MAIVTVDVFHAKTADSTLDGTAPTNAIKAADHNAAHKFDPVTVSNALGLHVVSGDPNGSLTAGLGELARDTTLGQLWLNTSGGSVWTSLVRADGGAALPPTFGSLLGDSNTTGIGDPSKGDPGFSIIADGDPNITFNARYATGTTNPAVWIDLTTGPLRCYAPPGASGMGMELTLGQTLFAAGASPWIAKMGMNGSTLATEWRPAASFLYQQWRDRMLAFQAVSNRKLGWVVVNLGTNDAANSGQASAFGANMTALATQIRADFNPGVVIVWLKTNVNSTPAFTSTVRSQQVTAAASDPLMILLDNDDQLLTDGFHYFSDGYLTLGARAAIAILDARGYRRATVTTQPDVIGWGPSARGPGALVVDSSPLAKAGDREYLYVCTANANTGITAPSGWTLVPSSAVTSTFSGLTTRISIFERLITQAMLDANAGRTAPTTLPDTNDVNTAKAFLVRRPTGSPTTHLASASANNTFSTALSVAGVTTTLPNARVLVFSGGFAGAPVSGTLANGTLTGLTDVQDGSRDNIATSDWMEIKLTKGVKATAGATGTSTATFTGNLIGVGATVAVI